MPPIRFGCDIQEEGGFGESMEFGWVRPPAEFEEWGEACHETISEEMILQKGRISNINLILDMRPGGSDQESSAYLPS